MQEQKERKTITDTVKMYTLSCSCAYREADSRQYGSCYCNLYVTPAWNEGKIPVDYVPERRPPEKMRA